MSIRCMAHPWMTLFLATLLIFAALLSVVCINGPRRTNAVIRGSITQRGDLLKIADFIGTKQTNICFDFQRACGGCPWSEYDPEIGRIRFGPVPGWTAESAVISSNEGGRRHEIKTMRITACPLFIPDPPRESDPGELTEGQLQRLMRFWERK